MKANELCDIADAETVLFEQSRQARDAWISFPDRIGPVLAAELDVEPEKLVEALTAHVHQQLADMGEPENPFREAGQAADGFTSRLDAAAAAGVDTIELMHRGIEAGAVFVLYAVTFAVQMVLWRITDAPLTSLGLENPWKNLVSFVIAQGVATVTNFELQRHWIFRESKVAGNPLSPPA